MSKFREVKIQPDVSLPALSTEVPGMVYKHIGFLLEWVLGAPGMRSDENLPHLFAFEELLVAKQPQVGDAIYVPEENWAACKTACKGALDVALTPDPMTGRQRLPAAWATKVLRYYHAFASAQAVNENDIPKPAPVVDASAVPDAEREKMAHAMTNGAAPEASAAPPAT